MRPATIYIYTECCYNSSNSRYFFYISKRKPYRSIKLFFKIILYIYTLNICYFQQQNKTVARAHSFKLVFSVVWFLARNISYSLILQVDPNNTRYVCSNVIISMMSPCQIYKGQLKPLKLDLSQSGAMLYRHWNDW